MLGERGPWHPTKEGGPSPASANPGISMTDTAVIVRDASGARATVFGGRAEDVARMAAIALGYDLDLFHFELAAGIEVIRGDERVGRMVPEYELVAIGSGT